MLKTYLQIGANVGNDEFYDIIQKLDERCQVILVEPNQDLIPLLQESYKLLKDKHNIIVCNKAISIIEGQVTFFKYSSSSGHSSLVKRKSHQVPADTCTVEAITFNNLCKMYNIQEIEYLYIDTEGLDYEIINSINFEEIKINNICFEEWPHEQDDLNHNFKTGRLFLETEVKPKIEKYFSYKQTSNNNFIYIAK